MVGERYVQKRASGYYYRQRVPHDLKSFFSKAEVVTSLKTSCPKMARDRAATLFAYVVSTFEEVRSISNHLDHSQAAQIAENWRKRALNEDFEYRLQRRFPPPSLRQKEQEVSHSLREMDFTNQQHWVTQVGRENGLRLEENGESWQRLAFYLAQAQLQALKEIEDRNATGNQRLGYYPEEEYKPEHAEEVITLLALMEKWQDRRAKNPRTIMDWQNAVRRFTELKGDLPIARITKQDIKDFRDTCIKMPANLPNKDRTLTIQKILQKYENKKVSRLSPRSVNKYIAAIKTILNLGVREGLIDKNPAVGISVEVSKLPTNRRMPFDSEELRKIFLLSPVYRFGDRPKGGAGEAAYWLPLLALFTGARLEELGQLRLADIREEKGIHYLDINLDDGKSIKNSGSIRKVPLHPKLVELGLKEEVQRLKMAGEKYLFPRLPHARSQCTAPYSKWVNRYISTTCGIIDSRKVFHSFRHTFKDACRRANIPRDVHDAITGHADSAVSSQYGLGFPIEILYDAVCKIKFESLSPAQMPKANTVVSAFPRNLNSDPVNRVHDLEQTPIGSPESRKRETPLSLAKPG